MLSLLGSLLGFGTSFLPKVMDYFQDRADKVQELKLRKLEIEAQAAGHLQRLEQLNVDADIREVEALHRNDVNTGVGWIDGLRGSVRPVITYAFFALFCFVEVSAYLALVAKGVNSTDALAIVWDQETRALFAAVMSFWFGNRAIEKYRGR